MTVYITAGSVSCSPCNIVKYPVEFSGNIEYLPYYKTFNEHKQSIDLLCQKIEQHIFIALKNANLDISFLDENPLFLSSTSFHISQGELLYPNIGETSLYQFNAISEKLKKNHPKWKIYNIATSCTSSANAIIYAKNAIDCHFYQNAIIVGFECFNDLSLSNFHAMGLISNTYQPFQEEGFILGEGIAVIVLQNNIENNVNAFTIKGSGCLNGKNNIAAVDFNTIQNTIEQALKNANIHYQNINLIKANAVGSNSDQDEKNIYQNLFPKTPMIFFKHQIGNTLGASVLIETVLLLHLFNNKQFTLLNNEKHSFRLPENNHTQGDILICGFGFGGNCTALVIGKNNTNKNNLQSTINKNLSLINVSQFNCMGKTDNQTLKQLIKQQFNLDARRLSRLTMSSLLGVLPLSIEDKNTSVYIGIAFSSPEKFQQQMMRLFNKEIAKPFDFIYNIANAPAFEITKSLDINGNALCCAVPQDEYTAWQQVLMMAISDLILGKTPNAIICLSYEDLNGDCQTNALLLSNMTINQKMKDINIDQNKSHFLDDLIQLLMITFQPA